MAKSDRIECPGPTFAFARALKYSPTELYRAASAPSAVRLGLALERHNAALLDDLHDLCAPEFSFSLHFAAQLIIVIAKKK